MHRVSYPVTHCKSAHVGTHGLDEAGTLHSQGEWRIERIQAAALVDVDEIDAHGLHADEGLIGGWRRIVDGFERKGVGFRPAG